MARACVAQDVVQCKKTSFQNGDGRKWKMPLIIEFDDSCRGKRVGGARIARPRPKTPSLLSYLAFVHFVSGG